MNDDAPEDEKRKLVANERAKLTATFLNGVAIAMVAIGGLAPVTSSLLSNAPFAPRDTAAILTTFALAVVLHAIARRLLGKLEP